MAGLIVIGILLNTIDAKYCEQCGEKFENAKE